MSGMDVARLELLCLYVFKVFRGRETLVKPQSMLIIYTYASGKRIEEAELGRAIDGMMQKELVTFSEGYLYLTQVGSSIIESREREVLPLRKKLIDGLAKRYLSSVDRTKK